MIYEKFDVLYHAIPFPSAKDFKNTNDHLLARKEYNAATAKVTEEFADALAETYLKVSLLRADKDSEFANKIFSQAWSDGHSAGYSEVENHYMDYAELANEAFTLGLASH